MVNDRVWMCVYTLRDSHYRIISVRLANNKERRMYDGVPRI